MSLRTPIFTTLPPWAMAPEGTRQVRARANSREASLIGEGAPGTCEGKRGLDTEIGLQLRHARLKAIGGNLVDHPATVHHVVAFGNRGGEFQILFHQHGGETPGP